MSETADLKANDTQNKSWHVQDPLTVAGELKTDLDTGLRPHEAKRRLQSYGPNELLRGETVQWWQVLIEQFKSVVVLLLLVAVIVSFAMGEEVEGASVLVVILLNAGIGFLTEYRANRAMEALRKLGTAEATVLRKGKRKTIPAADLVPGDVIVLQEGDSVPADARVIESAELRVEEASLTGEPHAVSKTVDPLADVEAPLADRSNMIYKSTHVTSGNGRAVVVATGMATEIGRVSELVSGVAEKETPLKRRLNQMGHKLIFVCLGVAGLVFLAGLVQGVEWHMMLRAAIALAVAAVPEGLPAVATITLAVGMKRMAERQALIRNLPSVETLGSATRVCTDKTGTLTRGEMTAHVLSLPDQRIEVTGGGYEPTGEFRRDGETIDPLADRGLRSLLMAGLLCNNATIETTEEGYHRISGDTTEGALTVAAAKAGLDADETRNRHPEVHELAFTSDVMMMATVNDGLDETYQPGGGKLLSVKGAPGKVLTACTKVLTDDGPAELDDATRNRLSEANEQLAGEGLRMLAMAYRPVTDVPEGGEQAYRDLIWIGMAGIVDPPRDEVRDTVDVLTRAGIQTVMITGDQPATAGRIAADLHVAPENAPVITGRELADADSDELARQVHDVEVFARVSPEQKVDICTALQKDGQIVAMLGDGVNDAIALKQADIGVAMGIKGTDVAKETADMLLLDDRFATVASAMQQGRIIFANIKKFVHYLFSCNLSEILVMLGASLLATIGMDISPLPLLPLQILWLNIVTDVFPALSLAMEPGEPDIMDRPPRDPQKGLLDRDTLVSIFAFAGMITLSTMTAFLVGSARYGKPVEGEPSPAITMSFMTIALAQLFHVVNSRKEGKPVHMGEWLSNRYIVGAAVLVIALQMVAVYVPLMQDVLDTVPLGAGDWLIVGCLSLLPMLAGQVIRRFTSHI